ncbi:capping protein-inhibiting regulator of actin dynamics [Embiotoca jacksoni]|uniref:capping protein-inhibiting regulator of actin dynamics n=1 Tax=Embiotoca jacksoni TaxID=100190 RepID=UPI0037049542
MESFTGDTEESTEDIPGRKMSKLTSLKTRLFWRRADGVENTKLSQSASDITAGKGLDSDEDSECSQETMGSRSLSHESIFLDDQALTDAEPARVLSQENVHSKIKALQMKLQQQKMHLGPPPMVLPIRRQEDLGGHSEARVPHSPPDVSGGDVTSQEALTKTISQPACRPLSPITKSALTKSLPLTPSHPFSYSVPSNSSSSAIEAPLDFSTPPQFTPYLDSSAARHRMSIKPKNKRASYKKKLTVTQSRSHSNSLNNIDHIEDMEAQEQQLEAQERMVVETEQGWTGIPVTSQGLSSKPAEVAPITSEAAPKSSSLSFPLQDHALAGTVASQVLRVKPYRRVDAMSSERPHSSYIESEKREDFEIQIMSHDKRNTLNKAATTEVSADQHPTSFGSGMWFRSSSVRQPVQGDDESTRGIKRSTPGSGSFHFSITSVRNRDGERPRSGSFIEVLEQGESRHKTAVGAEEKSTREKEELQAFQVRGGPFAVGRLRQEGAPPKSSVTAWDRRDSFKKVESVMPSKSVSADVEGEEGERRQEVDEEAKEVQEDEGKTAFGIKLRSTSQLNRFRSDAASNHHPKTALSEDQCDKQKRQEISDNSSYLSEKLPANTSNTPSTSGELRTTDPSLCGFSLPVKHNTPSYDAPVTPIEVQTTSSNPKEAGTRPQEPQPAPQTAPAEVSWMSLAMEKTRSIQQLFTSKFPRDFTCNVQPNMPNAGRPQAQVQPTRQTETVTETQTGRIQQSATEAANQPSADTAKAEAVEIRSPVQTVKPSPMGEQQKMSVTPPALSNTSREPPMSKQTKEDQPSTTQSVSYSVSHPAVQTNPWTTQSPLRSLTQTEATSQFAPGSATQSLAQSYLSSGQQQPSWSNRGLHSANQLKSTTSPSPAAVPPSVSASGRGEGEATSHQEAAALSSRRAVWAGSVSEKAAFLEKRVEWTAQPGSKGVELRKAPTETHTSGEPPASAKNTSLSKETIPEGRQGVKLAESSPTKVPDRPREDKWLWKNAASSLSPSSSPLLPSVLQSMPDSGQPSWMELAKRKSMAWSDKTMD